MRLVYEATGVPVEIGDEVLLRDGETAEVLWIIPPHKPSSTGRVGVGRRYASGVSQMEYFPSVIEAHWIEREDQL